MADNDDTQRGSPNAFEQQRQIQLLSHATRQLEIGFNVNKRKTVTITENQLCIIDAELLGVPILDQSIEHIEVVGEIDDARRITMRKSNWHGARESALW